MGYLWDLLETPRKISMVWTGWREVVRQFAAQNFKNPAWGYSHSVGDYKLAKDLAEADHATLDDDVLFAAAYLHDMAAFAPWDREKDGIDHARGQKIGPKAAHSLQRNALRQPSRKSTTTCVIRNRD